MKAIVCEMCSSNDVVKQDGVYVCQSCGTKYTPDEARKLMIEVEGPVDVSGSTVKLDKSTELNNLYSIARRAKDENNSEKAARYYDMILQQDPESWEANFYTVYYSSMQTNIANIVGAANRVSNVLPSTFSMISSTVPAAEQAKVCTEVTEKAMSLATVMERSAVSHYNGIDSEIRNKYTGECRDRIIACANICYCCGDAIDKNLPASDSINAIKNAAWKQGTELHKLIPNFSLAENAKDTIRRYETKIGQTDKAFYKSVLPEHIKQLENKGRGLVNKKNTATKNTKKFRPGLFIAGLILLIGGIILDIVAFKNLGDGSVLLVLLGGVLGIIGIILVFAGFPNKKTREQSAQNITAFDTMIAANSAELEKLKKELEQL